MMHQKYDLLVEFVENQMFFITFLLYLLNYKTQTFYFAMGSWDINRTVGWGWDISIYFWLSLFGSFFIFTISYGVIKLLKRKTNYKLSFAHIITMVLYVITSNMIDTHDYIVLAIGTLMWGLFILNLFKCKKIVQNK